MKGSKSQRERARTCGGTFVVATCPTRPPTAPAACRKDLLTLGGADESDESGEAVPDASLGASAMFVASGAALAVGAAVGVAVGAAAEVSRGLGPSRGVPRGVVPSRGVEALLLLELPTAVHVPLVRVPSESHVKGALGVEAPVRNWKNCISVIASRRVQHQNKHALSSSTLFTSSPRRPCSTLHLLACLRQTGSARDASPADRQRRSERRCHC